MHHILNTGRKYGRIALRLLYPVRCPFCDEIVPGFEKLICDTCREELTPIKDYCMKCGKHVGQGEEYCSSCREISHNFSRGRCLLPYEGKTRKSIYRYKYGNRQEYAKAYAQLMAEEMSDFIQNCRADALIPVPLHIRRQQKRGYNQATLLAKALGSIFHIPVYSHLICRTKNTIPQKKLTFSQRQNKLKRAFKFIRNDVKLNTIIIIDDIYTTGSTIDAIAHLCQEKGIKNIYFLTIAGGK